MATLLPLYLHALTRLLTPLYLLSVYTSHQVPLSHSSHLLCRIGLGQPRYRPLTDPPLHPGRLRRLPHGRLRTHLRHRRRLVQVMVAPLARPRAPS